VEVRHKRRRCPVPGIQMGAGSEQCRKYSCIWLPLCYGNSLICQWGVGLGIVILPLDRRVTQSCRFQSACLNCATMKAYGAKNRMRTIMLRIQVIPITTVWRISNFHLKSITRTDWPPRAGFSTLLRHEGSANTSRTSIDHSCQTLWSRRCEGCRR